MSQVFVRKASTLAAADRAAVEAAARDAMNALEHQARAAEPAASERSSVVQIGRGQIEIAGFATQALVESDWYRPFVRPQPSAEVRRLPDREPALARAAAAGRPVLRDRQRRGGRRPSLRLRSLRARPRHPELARLRVPEPRGPRGVRPRLRVAASLFCLDARSRARALVRHQVPWAGLPVRGPVGRGQVDAREPLRPLLRPERRDGRSSTWPTTRRSCTGRRSAASPASRATSATRPRSPPSCLLVQSPRNALARLAAAEAFRRLGRRAFVPAKAQKARVAALDLVDDAVRCRPGVRHGVHQGRALPRAARPGVLRGSRRCLSLARRARRR